MKKSLFLLLFSLGVANSATAITLQQSYDLALKNDLEYARAGYALAGAISTANSSYAGILPQVGLKYSWGLQRDLSLPKALAQLETSSVQLALQQNLFNYGNFLKLDIAQQQKRQAEVTYLTARQDLINRVITGYVAVLKADADLQISLNQVKYLQDVVDTTIIRYRKGIASAVDVDTVKAQLNGAQAEAIGNQAKLQKALNDFRIMVGKDADLSQFFTLDSKLPHLSYPSKIDAITVTNNLTLKSLAMTKAIAKVGTEVGIAALFPTVQLQASIANNPKNTIQPGERNWGQAHQLDKVYVGINISLPIFMGGQIYNGIKTAQSQYQQATLGYDLAYQKTQTALESNLLAIQANERIVATYELSYQASLKAFKSKTAAYKFGVSSVTEVFNSVNQLYQTEQKLQAAKFDYITAVMNQKLLAGKLSESDLATLNKYFNVQKNVNASLVSTN